MATTILSAFSKLRSNLEITDLQAKTVATRQSTLREKIGSTLEVNSDFLAGSYMRNTMISPLKKADVDVFIVLDKKYWDEANSTASPQANLLERLKRALLKHYTTPSISRDGQAISIQFSDFIVDVVPAFHRVGGGYLIPDSIGKRWVATNPTAHTSYMSTRNSEEAGSLVPLIKMVKGWNMTIHKYFNSFYLEILTSETLRYKSWDSYPYGLYYVLKHGADFAPTALYDPVGYGSLITPGAVKEDIKSRFTTALGRCEKAIEYETNGKVELAVGEWRKIFGDYFPAYG